ncbi:hypothetical protein V6N13_001819 [Hibiscus sabdariffa]
MLRTAEGDMKKSGSKSILVVREAKRKEKKVAKSKGVGKTKHKGKNVLKPKGGISKEGKCFHCEKSDHWKRNCPVYLEEVKKAKAVGASLSGIYVIDVNMSTSSSWVLDTGCGSHICTFVQGLHMRRNQAKGDVDLRVGNGARVVALAWKGVSERRNRTLLDMVRSMMSHSDLPISFWGHALETTAFTLNRVPSKSVQKTPYEIWTGKRPKFLSNKRDRTNIELKEVQQQQQVTEPEVEQTSQVVEENSTNLETQPLRRSTRERHEPERYGFLVTTHGDVILVDQDEPKTYQEVVSSLDSEKWLEAMRYKMDSMSNNQVWTLVEPPEGIKPIGCKWVFKKKTDMDGNVQTNKGRLVAKGFRQIHGIDYDETFSPVAMFKSIRILLAIAAFHDYEIWQMDVKTAFLNGKLEEDVYMT